MVHLLAHTHGLTKTHQQLTVKRHSVMSIQKYKHSFLSLVSWDTQSSFVTRPQDLCVFVCVCISVHATDMCNTTVTSYLY